MLRPALWLGSEEWCSAWSRRVSRSRSASRLAGSRTSSPVGSSSRAVSPPGSGGGRALRDRCCWPRATRGSCPTSRRWAVSLGGSRARRLPPSRPALPFDHRVSGGRTSSTLGRAAIGGSYAVAIPAAWDNEPAAIALAACSSPRPRRAASLDRTRPTCPAHRRRGLRGPQRGDRGGRRRPTRRVQRRGWDGRPARVRGDADRGRCRARLGALLGPLGAGRRDRSRRRAR